eukprot:1301212-Ditylum_brightwellii.AAC.1
MHILCGGAEKKFLPCKEYQKKREEEGKRGAANEQKKKDNFKVSLSVLLSDDNFESIEEQFLNQTAREARDTHVTIK